MIVYAGTKHPSFAQGSEALAELAGMSVAEKQVERVTRRIGQSALRNATAMSTPIFVFR